MHSALHALTMSAEWQDISKYDLNISCTDKFHIFGQPGVDGANHRGGSQLMRFTRLNPGGQCHCCLANMSM
jgi:hypothetical protein